MKCIEGPHRSLPDGQGTGAPVAEGEQPPGGEGGGVGAEVTGSQITVRLETLKIYNNPVRWE